MFRGLLPKILTLQTEVTCRSYLYQLNLRGNNNALCVRSKAQRKTQLNSMLTWAILGDYKQIRCLTSVVSCKSELFFNSKTFNYAVREKHKNPGGRKSHDEESEVS